MATRHCSQSASKASPIPGDVPTHSDPDRRARVSAIVHQSHQHASAIPCCSLYLPLDSSRERSYSVDMQHNAIRGILFHFKPCPIPFTLYPRHTNIMNQIIHSWPIVPLTRTIIHHITQIHMSHNTQQPTTSQTLPPTIEAPPQDSSPLWH